MRSRPSALVTGSLWLALLATLGAAVAFVGGPAAALRRSAGHIARLQRVLQAPAGTDTNTRTARRSSTSADTASTHRGEAHAPPSRAGNMEGAEPSPFARSVLTSLGPISAARGSEVRRPRPDVGQDLPPGRVVTGASRRRLLVLTFDDGPAPGSTDRLLRTLRDRRVRAAFFLTTSWLRRGAAGWRARRRLARRAAADGHLMAAHGYEHVQLPLLDSEAVETQLDHTAALFEATVGAPVRLFRPPGGARSLRTDQLVEQRGWTQVLWNLGTGDPQVRSAEQVVQTFWRVLARREKEHEERGGIVLLHDIHPWTVRAVPLLLDGIAERNCALWRAGEELYDVAPAGEALRWFVVPRHPGRFGEEAPAARPDGPWWRRRQRRLRREAARRCGPPRLGPLAVR